jgi:predicted nucleic acid-binding protein
MPEGVIVETNWLFDIALQRDPGSQTIWQLAQAGRLDLYLPALCVTESIKAFELQHRGWGQLMSQITGTLSDLRRSAVFMSQVSVLSGAHDALDEVRDRAEAELWDSLDQICDRAALLDLNRATVLLARSLRDLLALDPADALILAAVEEASNAAKCSRFMSRDSVFNAEAVRAYMASRRIEFFRDPRHFLARYAPDSLQR